MPRSNTLNTLQHIAALSCTHDLNLLGSQTHEKIIFRARLYNEIIKSIGQQEFETIREHTIDPLRLLYDYDFCINLVGKFPSLLPAVCIDPQPSEIALCAMRSCKHKEIETVFEALSNDVC